MKTTGFIFPMTNITILGVFRTHAQEEYGKVWEMKSTPTYSLHFSTFIFLKLAMHFLKSGLNGTQYKDVS